MKNIKRIIMVMTVVFALFNFLAVQSKAAEWTEDEVVNLIQTKINKQRVNDFEKNRNLEIEIKNSLRKDRAKIMYVYMGILLAISLFLCAVAVKTRTPNYIVGAAILWLTVVPVGMIIFDGYPSEEEVAQRKAEMGIETADETEFVRETISGVLDEIYSSGDTVKDYQIEEATKEITRKIGILEGKVLN